MPADFSARNRLSTAVVPDAAATEESTRALTAAHVDRRTFAFTTALVVACGVAFLIVFSVMSYRDAIRSAETATHDYAEILAGRLDGALRAADWHTAYLQRALPAQWRAALASEGAAAFWDADLHWRVSRFPELAGVRVFDANGDLLYTSHRSNVANANIGDRPHFRRTREIRDDRSDVSSVLLARTTGQRTVVVSRPIRNDASVFLGIATASLDFDHFLRIFAALQDIDPQGVIAVFRTDTFEPVFRWPIETTPDFRTLPEDTVTRIAVEKGATSVITEATSPVDGITRIFATRTLAKFPFMVSVGYSKASVLKDWYTRTAAAAASTTLLLALLLFVSKRLRESNKAVDDSHSRLQEITRERAKLAAALKDSERRLRLGLSAGQVGLWDTSFDGGATWRSKTCARIFGDAIDATEPWTPADFLARVADADRDRVTRLLGDQRPDAPIEFECRINTSDGRERWILVRGERYVDEVTRERRGTGAVVDIDALQRTLADLAASQAELALKTEQLEAVNSDLESIVRERTQALEGVAHHIAHNLRTPLRAMDSRVYLLQEEVPALAAPPASGHVDRIRRNVERMSALIDGLLRFTSLGVRDVVIRPLDLDRIVRDVVREAVASHHSDSPVRIEVTSALPEAWGDEGLVRMVFAELLKNAMKFAVAVKEPHVRISAETDETGQTVHCAVADNGQGFDPAYSERVFHLFERLDPQDGREGEGIGLAIAYRAMRMQRGDLRARGSVGEGATFIVSLKAAAEGGDPASNRASAA